MADLRIETVPGELCDLYYRVADAAAARSLTDARRVLREVQTRLLALHVHLTDGGGEILHVTALGGTHAE